MIRERRQHVRHPVSLECSWTHDARVTDLSPAGCFVSCRFVPKAGDEIEFAITFGDVPVRVRGTVVNVRHDLGFGFVFGNLSDETRSILRAALAKATHASSGEAGSGSRR
jgi:PilZ domain